MEGLAELDPSNQQWQHDLSVCNNKIGDALAAQGDGPGALTAYRAGLAIRVGLANHDPANTQWQRDLLISNLKIGDVLMAQGDSAGALDAYQAGLAIREGLSKRDPAKTEWQPGLSLGHIKIGDALIAQGDSAGALEAYQLGLAIKEDLSKRDPANIQWQVDVALTSAKLGLSRDAVPLPSRLDYLNRGHEILLSLKQARRLRADQDLTSLFKHAIQQLKDGCTRTSAVNGRPGVASQYAFSPERFASAMLALLRPPRSDGQGLSLPLQPRQRSGPAAEELAR